MAGRRALLPFEIPEGLYPAALLDDYSRAKDAGLVNHRKQFLPIHFTKTALQRYAEAYRFACVGPKPRSMKAQQRAAERQERTARIKAMTAKERADFFGSERTAKRLNLPAWRQEQRAKLMWTMRSGRGLISTGARERSKDRNNEVPLYETGEYKGSLLRGAAVLSGGFKSRRMTLSAPQPYAHVVVPNWRGPGLNKTKAAEATIPYEWEAFGRAMEQSLQRDFDQM
jgi:hypothetical protein